MTAYRGQATWMIDPEIWCISGLVLTDGSGVPTNANTGAVLDQDGDALIIPRGLTSITKPATGTYRLTLEKDWWKIRGVDAMLFKSAGVNAGFQVKQFNPKGFVVNSVPAQSIDLIYQVAGTATDLISAGFYLTILLKAVKAGG